MRILLMCASAAVLGSGGIAGEITVTGGPTRSGEQHLPANVVDGKPDTVWSGADGNERWRLEFDLRNEQTIGLVRVTFVSARQMPADITGDISTDGRQWQPLGALPLSNPSELHVGQTMRFFRLNLEGPMPAKAPQIREVAFLDAERAAAETDTPIKEILYPSDADGTLQPARFFPGRGGTPVPLVVGLHTWSGNYQQRYLPLIEDYCVRNGWVYIHPDFRGPNWTPQATGSDLVVKDILSAVRHARRVAAVDPQRIYLVGGSGGGYHALLMAGRAPDVWTAVSAWVPIADLTAWYHESRARKSGYADHIVKSCGGEPGASAAVDAELRARSPVTHLANARGLPLDINAGIHDGHRGSVPISHSLIAFNCTAAPEDRIAPEDIEFMTLNQAVPDHLRQPLTDAAYGANAPLFRRQSGSVRVTIFEGGHQVVEKAALEWLAAQRRQTVAP